MSDQIHDKGYKRLFARKSVFLHFIQTYLGESWMEELLEEDLELLDKEFIPSHFHAREGDLVYGIRCKDSQILFFIFLELQSTVDFTMSFRLLCYQTDLWSRFYDNSDLSKGCKEFRLPDILPVVLYNGLTPWSALRRFEPFTLGLPGRRLKKLDFEYYLVDVARISPDKLKAYGTVLECVFLLDQSRDSKSLKQALLWVAEILPRLSQGDRRALAQWTGDVLMKKIPDDRLEDEILIALEKGEVERMYTGIERAFDYEYNKGRKEGLESGLEQGLEQGKSLERREMARRLLALGVDPETVIAASGLTEEQIHEDVVPYLTGAEGQR